MFSWRHALSIDPRLKDAARTHLAEFATHEGQYSDRYSGEPSLIDRVAAAKISCTSAGEVLLKLPDTTTDDAQRKSIDYERAFAH